VALGWATKGAIWRPHFFIFLPNEAAWPAPERAVLSSAPCPSCAALSLCRPCRGEKFPFSCCRAAFFFFPEEREKNHHADFFIFLCRYSGPWRALSPPFEQCPFRFVCTEIFPPCSFFSLLTRSFAFFFFSTLVCANPDLFFVVCTERPRHSKERPYPSIKDPLPRTCLPPPTRTNSRLYVKKNQRLASWPPSCLVWALFLSPSFPRRRPSLFTALACSFLLLLNL